MFLYSDLEKELVDLLNDYYSSSNLPFEAKMFPEKDSEAKLLDAAKEEKPQTVVKFKKSSYSAEENIGYISQDKTLEIYIILFNENARGDAGVDKQSSHTEMALLGYRPANCSDRITMLGYEPVDWENLNIRDTLTIKTKKKIVQQFHLNDGSEIIGGPFKRETVLQK